MEIPMEILTHFLRMSHSNSLSVILMMLVVMHLAIQTGFLMGIHSETPMEILTAILMETLTETLKPKARDLETQTVIPTAILMAIHL